MEYISLAGTAWLARHGLTIDRMVDRWNSNRRVTPHPTYLEREADPNIEIPNGDIARSGNFWLTEQYHRQFHYREYRSRHAKLIINNFTLPETVLTGLYKSVTPLENVVQMPEDFVAANAEGRIIRANNLYGTSVEFLLRITWLTTNMAWTLERVR